MKKILPISLLGLSSLLVFSSISFVSTSCGKKETNPYLELQPGDDVSFKTLIDATFLYSVAYTKVSAGFGGMSNIDTEGLISFIKDHPEQIY
jgi:hypothetical protein